MQLVTDSSEFTRPTIQRQDTKSVNQSAQPEQTGFATKKSVNVLMIGTGEYTTGYTGSKVSLSDKGAGVVALTMFDLRRRGKVGRVVLCGVNGTKFPQIREHMQKSIADVYEGLNITLETYPSDDIVDSKSYIRALDSMEKGDAVIVFTPDDTHCEIGLQAVRRGLHVLVTKPVVKTLQEHRQLQAAAEEHGALVATEVHKRFDPIYQDARDRLRALGPISYLYAYMSQPKYQLETFRAWAGDSSKSDISYYLNSHHVDFHEWCVGDTARPVLVTATASTGVASAIFRTACEDTITLTVQWEQLDESAVVSDPSTPAAAAGVGGKDTMTPAPFPTPAAALSTAVYTASWIAPKADVHSQQRFFCLAQRGEVTVDQAHRGYTVAADGEGFKSVNPLFMKYTPTARQFAGQQGYGYRSLEAFVDTVSDIRAGLLSARDLDSKGTLATLRHSHRTTAILEAGRRSLDEQCSVRVLYEDPLDHCLPTALTLAHC